MPRRRSKPSKRVRRTSRKPTRQGRKRLTREQLETEFETMLGELEAEKALRQQAENEKRKLQKDVARMFMRAEETPSARHARLAVSFDLETRYLLPRRGENMRGALENWASRNGWTSDELWAEYRRTRPPGFHKSIMEQVFGRKAA